MGKKEREKGRETFKVGERRQREGKERGKKIVTILVIRNKDNGCTLKMQTV